MANVEKYLQDILDAVYGEEVRGSIHDAIEAMNVESTNAEAAAISSRDSARNYATAAGESKDAAEAAKTAAQTAQTGAVNAKTAAEAAKTAAQTAQTGAVNAKTAAEAAKTAAQTAKTGAETAQTGAVNAKTSAEAANTAAQTAKTGAVNAQTAAEAAKTAAQASATAAADSETNASSSETNAEHWADVAQQYAKGGLHFCGTVKFANIPTSGMSNGDEYNIDEDFVTDNRFIEGPGIKVKTGTDIAWVENINETVVRKWNVLATGESVDLTETTVNGNPVSFTTDSSGISRNTIVTLEPIQSGSGDPSPTNVRPISGYDSISITSSGRNLWHGGNVSGTNYKQKAFSLPSGTYTISAVCTSSDTSASVCYVLFLNSLGGGLASVALNRNTRSSATFTLSSDASYARFYASDWDHSSGNTFTFSDIQIEKGSTATTYDAPTTTTINTPSTIYGGTYDVETGELTVDRALVDLGTLNWSYVSSDAQFSAVNAGISIKSASNMMCSKYKTQVISGWTDMTDNSIARHPSSMSWFRIKDTAYTDATAFKASLSGVQLAYELATPYTIQLEPHLLNLFEGQNNVSTNGTQISVTYRNGIVARVDDFNAVGESVNKLGNDKVPYEANGVLGAKNFLEYPYYGTSATINGITWTIYDDGSVKANGTASAISELMLHNRSAFDFDLSAGDYILSGCPSGGGDNTYNISVYRNATKGNASQFVSLGIDKGSGVPFTMATESDLTVKILIKSGQTVSNLMFYPMIRLASDTDKTFQPYAKTNRQLTTDKAESSALAPVENGATASKAYAVGEHFYRDGAFCTAKASIAKDAQFTLGTNYTAGTIEGALGYHYQLNITHGQSYTFALPTSGVYLLIVSNGQKTSHGAYLVYSAGSTANLEVIALKESEGVSVTLSSTNNLLVTNTSDTFNIYAAVTQYLVG